MAEETRVQQLARERAEKQKELQLEAQQFSLPALAEMTGYNEQMLMVLQKSVAKNTSPAEFAYFLTVCKDSGLSPVNKEIWCYKDHQGNVIVFTGRDGFLKKNKQNPTYRGMKSSEVCEYDEFEIDMISSEVKHKITNNRGKPIGAYAIVSIEGQEDTIVYLDFAEFNLGQAKWKTAPKMMIKKCAQSHALKEAAGMSGIQAEESAHIRNGVATFDVEHEEVKAPDSDEKAEERLLKMIEGAETRESLLPLSEHCNSILSKEKYDEKWAELGE